MTTPETIKPMCGDCKFFDPNRILGGPLGVVRIEDGDGVKIVKEGFCRTFWGLFLVPLPNEMSKCRMPKGTFQPKRNEI